MMPDREFNLDPSKLIDVMVELNESTISREEFIEDLEVVVLHYVLDAANEHIIKAINKNQSRIESLINSIIGDAVNEVVACRKDIESSVDIAISWYTNSLKVRDKGKLGAQAAMDGLSECKFENVSYWAIEAMKDDVHNAIGV